MDDLDNIEDKIHEFFHSLPCQSETPFPPIKVSVQNLEYANLLLDAYASSADSEIQAITQYLFHAKTIEDKTISNTLECTALIEMHHLDVLGELITLLGGKPFFLNSNMNFWMTGNIAYIDKLIIYERENQNNMNDKLIIKKKLEKDIVGEINAINNYRILHQNIKDPYIRAILLKIISDEQVHKSNFEKLVPSS